MESKALGCKMWSFNSQEHPSWIISWSPHRGVTQCFSNCLAWPWSETGEIPKQSGGPTHQPRERRYSSVIAQGWPEAYIYILCAETSNPICQLKITSFWQKKPMIPIHNGDDGLLASWHMSPHRSGALCNLNTSNCSSLAKAQAQSYSCASLSGSSVILGRLQRKGSSFKNLNSQD